MGVFMAEPSGALTEQIFTGSNLTDSNKKKRRSRKSKQTMATCSFAGDMCIDATNSPRDETTLHEVESYRHEQLPEETKVDVRLMPLNESSTASTSQAISQKTKEVIYSSSAPVPTATEESPGLVLVTQEADIDTGRKYFPPHWSAEAVNKALKKGELFTALFHINAYNKLEAYCKIDGLQTDILISGVVAQNRAVEGDTVAIVIDPPSFWPRMKGSNGSPSSSASSSSNNHPEGLAQGQIASDKNNNVDTHCATACSSTVLSKVGPYPAANEHAHEAIPDNGHVHGLSLNNYVTGCQSSVSDSEIPYRGGDANDSVTSLEMLCIVISLYPLKRPTGSVVAVIERSHRRDNVVGFLGTKQFFFNRVSKTKMSRKNKLQSDENQEYILLAPTDPKFTKMIVPVSSLPRDLKERLEDGDSMIEYDLVAAKIVDWAEECHIPEARLIKVLGRGSDVDAQIAASLFENAIDASDFSSEVLDCLPHIPWKVSRKELKTRLDLRNVCVFTIDPATATDLDDALSVEKLPNDLLRIGVHIADVSHFVQPDTAIDMDAQIRSTSVYLLHGKLPMLPSMLSDNVASLNPGEDRLAFSILWDISPGGEILDRWIGRTVIRSCCKLSYEYAQEIISCSSDIQHPNGIVNGFPALYGDFNRGDVTRSIKSLHEVSKVLRNNRFKSGAVLLECPKITFKFDGEGLPYDTAIGEHMDSHFLVEEFMLLANTTAADLITRAYPSSALLRRHSEPNARKLEEFASFCNKHGLKLDTSSSAHLHQSLDCIRTKLKNDPVLSSILMSYAARPMQLAAYICSGDYKDSSSIGHYALAVPLYTHFTSPLRRYPDIVVHRTLAAVLEAETTYLETKRKSKGILKGKVLTRCFTGLSFDKEELESIEAQEALSSAALNYRLPGCETLSNVASHCNVKKLAARRVQEATDRICMWVLLKKKEVLYTEARVVGLGPKFMSVYIPELAIDKRIYYDESEGLTVTWLESTSTLILSNSTQNRYKWVSGPGYKSRAIEDVILVTTPTDLNPESNLSSGENGGSERGEKTVEPAFFPLTIHLLSTIPVALHAVGGDGGPIDIVARLYACSYFC